MVLPKQLNYIPKTFVNIDQSGDLVVGVGLCVHYVKHGRIDASIHTHEHMLEITIDSALEPLR